MAAIALLSLAVLLFIFIGYPLSIAALAAIFGRKVNTGDHSPSVTLIISAYNEEKVIEEKLRNTLELDYPKDKLEVIVASESTDSTNQIVQGFSKNGIKLLAFENREGKRATLFKVVPLATGEIIVFSDANAIYQKDALSKLTRNFYDERIGCVSGQLKYVNKSASNIGEGESAYWNFEVLIKKLSSRLFSLGGGVNGSIFAIRKSLYNPIDKFRGDDFEISAMVEIGGKGVVLDCDAVSFEDTSETSRQEFQRKVRLASWNMVSCLMLLSRSIASFRPLTTYILFSHRFLRYTTPIWLISLFISCLFLIDTDWKYLLILQSFLYLAALAGFLIEKAQRKVRRIFLVPYYFCVMNAAALTALAKNIFGRNQMLWEKVR